MKMAGEQGLNWLAQICHIRKLGNAMPPNPAPKLARAKPGQLQGRHRFF
jgi:hypothetical protein